MISSAFDFLYKVGSKYKSWSCLMAVYKHPICEQEHEFIPC